MLAWLVFTEAEKYLQNLLRVIGNHLPSEGQPRDHCRHSIYVHQSQILLGVSPGSFAFLVRTNTHFESTRQTRSLHDLDTFSLLYL